MFERYWVEQETENHFAVCFTLSFLFSAVSIMVTHFFVPFSIQGQDLSGIISVLLASLTASYPLIRYLEMREEDTEDVEDLEELELLKRHWTELEIYLAFFLGVTLAFSLSSFLLPASFFTNQDAVIGSISGKLVSQGLFMEIITNNLSVFILTFVLSFLLTAGMVFILVWNASVLGVFLAKISESFFHLPIAALSYLPHGVLEIGAYILAGISGFFLSHEFPEFWGWDEKTRTLKLMESSIVVFGLGLLMLVLAALLESLAL